MRKRFFRRSPLRELRKALSADFRVVVLALLGLVALGIGLRFGLTNETAVPTPAPSPSIQRLPPDPGFAASAGPEEVRRAMFRLLDIGAPVYCGGGRQPLVALTIDDGPGLHTDELLSILGSRGTPATFFVVGNRLTSEYGRGLIRRIGPLNAVGNHTWSHASFRSLKRSRRLAEIRRAQRAIEDVTSSARLFRPPYGHRSRSVDRLVNRQGLLEVLWNVTVGDDRPIAPDLMLATLRAELRPGAIVLLHEHPTTIAALPRIIDEIEARGLRPVTVPDLLALDPPSDRQLRRHECRTATGLAPAETGGGRP